MYCGKGSPGCSRRITIRRLSDGSGDPTGAELTFTVLAADRQIRHLSDGSGDPVVF